MSGMSLPTRIALFFYSLPNIVGCVCALAVLGLYFFGIIAQWWLALTVGAYVFGWLVTPATGRFEHDFAEKMSMLDVLDALLERTGSKLPTEALQALKVIRGKVQELLPVLEKAEFSSQAGMELGNTIRRDLPATLANYLALPAGFASLHVVRDGKTAKQLLLEQLALFDGEITEMANDIYGEDADKLAAHGDYLRSKFQPVNFLEA